MTALTDLKLYYFLDQGRQNDSFAGFSCFFYIYENHLLDAK